MWIPGDKIERQMMIITRQINYPELLNLNVTVHSSKLLLATDGKIA